MKWEEIRIHYPNQWLLIEALEAHSESGKRILDKLAVVDVFDDSRKAMQSYARLHHQEPNRELYVLHTDRKELDITERKWIGIRGVR